MYIYICIYIYMCIISTVPMYSMYLCMHACMHVGRHISIHIHVRRFVASIAEIQPLDKTGLEAAIVSSQVQSTLT